MQHEEQLYFHVSVHVSVLHFLSLADIPHNIPITESGRGSGGEVHPLDVIVLVKRYAADEELCQDWL